MSPADGSGLRSTKARRHKGSKSVGQAAKEAEKTCGAPVKIASYVRYALGEGIEKKEEDFAAEVAAAAGTAKG